MKLRYLMIFPVIAGFYILFMKSDSASQKKSNKNEILVAWENLPRTIDPRNSTDMYSQYLDDLIHCSLFNFDSNGNQIKELAENWRWGEDFLEVSIKDKLTFTNGDYVTSNDVAATYSNFLKDSANRSPRANGFSNVKSIKVIDNKVIFYFDKISPSFLTELVVGILPEKWAKKKTLPSSAVVPTCGAFQLEQMSINGIRLKANEKYSLGKVPSINKIHIKKINSDYNKIAKLENGELDIVQNGVSYEFLNKIKNNKNISVSEQISLNTSYIGLNFKNVFLKKKEVREAISLGINRKLILEKIFHNHGSIAKTLILPGDKYFNNKLIFPEYNPEKAREILKKSGLENISLELSTKNSVLSMELAKTIASDLNKIGIKIIVNSFEWGKLKENIDSGISQMWILAWVGFKDPDIYRYVFSSSNFPPDGANRGFFKNEILDNLLEAGKYTVDDSKRLEIYKKIQEIIDYEKPYIFLFHNHNIVIKQNFVQNFKPYADGRFSDLKTAFISKY